MTQKPDDLDLIIVIAMNAINNLAAFAKNAGDLPTMYSANRAWSTLFEAREDLAERRKSPLRRHEQKKGE